MLGLAIVISSDWRCWITMTSTIHASVAYKYGNYSRDLRSAEWGPAVILRSNNAQDRMSALGHKQTYAAQKGMSALPPIATAKADSGKQSCLLYPQKRTFIRSPDLHVRVATG